MKHRDSKTTRVVKNQSSISMTTRSSKPVPWGSAVPWTKCSAFCYDGSGETGWHYDGLGRPVSEQRVVVVDSTSYTFTTAYGGYDNAGKPGWMQYPGGPDGSLGEVVQYGYDENAALESLLGDSTYVSSINYDYMGRITQLVRGAAVLTTDYSYYPWDAKGGRLQSLETSNSTSTLQDLAYNYDQVGNS